MSNQTETMGKIEQIVAGDARYRSDAYVFTLEALSFTLDQRRKAGQEGHIDGPELLLGIRDYARKLFGYLGATVFAAWGIGNTGDFGEIVFSLVDVGLLSKQDSDTKEDFADLFDLAEAFEADYIYE